MAKGGYPTLVHASQDLRAIPGALGIPASRVEGVDPFAVRDAVSASAGHKAPVDLVAPATPERIPRFAEDGQTGEEEYAESREREGAVDHPTGVAFDR